MATMKGKQMWFTQESSTADQKNSATRDIEVITLKDIHKKAFSTIRYLI
jgi:hypothetical protein